jgi:hypothetical protein
MCRLEETGSCETPCSRFQRLSSPTLPDVLAAYQNRAVGSGVPRPIPDGIGVWVGWGFGVGVGGDGCCEPTGYGGLVPAKGEAERCGGFGEGEEQTMGEAFDAAPVGGERAFVVEVGAAVVAEAFGANAMAAGGKVGAIGEAEGDEWAAGDVGMFEHPVVVGGAGRERVLQQDHAGGHGGKVGPSGKSQVASSRSGENRGAPPALALEGGGAEGRS